MSDTLFCPNCGKKVDAQQACFCPECGSNLKPYIEAKNNTSYNTYSSNITNNNYSNVSNKDNKSYPMVVAGQVLATISILLINPLMILSILALIFSSIGYSQAKGDNNDKQAKKAIGAILASIFACIWFVVSAYIGLNKLGIQLKLF